MKTVVAIGHVLVWVALLAAFFCMGARKVVQQGALSSAANFNIESFHSTDSFLRFCTGLSQLSPKLIALFDSFPAGKKMLIIYSDNDPVSSLLGKLTAYLAWPRSVEMIDLARTRLRLRDVAATDPNKFSAVVFCRVKQPAALSGGKHFGTNFEIVPLQ